MSQVRYVLLLEEEVTGLVTAFELGQSDGQWTMGKAYSCGCTSAQEFYEQQEQTYQDELAGLLGLAVKNPASAVQHADYLEGWISSVRNSMRALG